MIRQVGVAVIGAGLAGLAAVAEIRKAKRDFVLIDGANALRSPRGRRGPAGDPQ